MMTTFIYGVDAGLIAEAIKNNKMPKAFPIAKEKADNKILDHLAYTGWMGQHIGMAGAPETTFDARSYGVKHLSEQDFASYIGWGAFFTASTDVDFATNGLAHRGVFRSVTDKEFAIIDPQDVPTFGTMFPKNNFIYVNFKIDTLTRWAEDNIKGTSTAKEHSHKWLIRQLALISRLHVDGFAPDEIVEVTKDLTD